MLKFDYKKNIADTRTIFNNKSPHVGDELLRPTWMRNDDSLNQIFIDQDKLYGSGKVFWGFLVQANVEIFKPAFSWSYIRSPANPAAIVFSSDPYFDENPGELGSIARELYNYKNKPFAPSDIKEITDAITGEMKRLFNIKLPDSITKGREIYYTTIMIIRKHIPKKRLIGPLFPILANPEQFETCIILPKHYWTRSLRRNFCRKK